ncbi:MAG: ATP-binding protein, partial [Desulfobulbaceae bacterium]|nr:ATP-binding protein [Desulfobulbaceae bacterium]
AAAATILYASILTLEQLDHLPPHLHAKHPPGIEELLSSMNLFSVYGITFFFTALLSGIIAGRLRSTEAALSKTALQLDRISLLYERIFNDIHTGIVTIDGDDMISSCNPAAEKITGFNAIDLIGTKFRNRFPEIIPSNSGRNVAELHKENGKIIRIGYSFSRLNMVAKESSSKDLQKEECERCKIITIQDISKIEEMEKKVIETQNMAAIGRLSASIAHDFRNPLAAISGCAQMLAGNQNGQPEQDSDTRKRLTEIILRESDRMAKTITDFLQYARPAPIKLEWCNVKRLLLETVENRITAGYNNRPCEIEMDLEDNLSVWADRQQLQTTIMHLLDNSCSASAESQEPVIICAREDTWRGKGIILLEIIDKGTGISDKIQGKIFNPFFSTREDGTGLGLAIVKHIIEHHHGSVELFSIKGQGCTMQIKLPLPEESITPEPS